MSLNRTTETSPMRSATSSITLSSNILVQAVPEEEALKEQVDVPFSGEEVGGRYLDMHTHYHAFVNSKFGRQCDYVEYLVTFGHTDEISRQHRLSKPYRCALLR
jgi:hypothetical protein